MNWYLMFNSRLKYFQGRYMAEGASAGGQDGQSASGGSSGAGVQGAGAGASGKSTTQGESVQDRTFTQKDLDTILAKEKRQLQTKHLEETEELLKSKGLTEQERERLAKRKDELETALMTEKDKARSEREKLEKEYQAAISAKDSEVKGWQGRFTAATVRREISDAAVLADAHDPSQFVDLLESKCRLQEIIGDDAQPTGQFEVVIDYLKADEKTGKSKKITIPVEKYITEVMSEETRYKNLFDSGRVGGTGFRPGAGTGGSGGSNLTSVQKISRGLRALSER